MSVNPDIVRARCAEIDQALARLEELRSLSREELLGNQDFLDVACYRLLVAIEAALSLCFHVSAKRLKKIPEEYAGCFTNLQEAGLVSEELADRLRQMARFRNLLIHVYWKIDYGQMYELLQTRLDDLRAFRTAMAQVL
jgi:uncharacterized protein YutE (UPF0331/DUF86 family)